MEQQKLTETHHNNNNNNSVYNATTKPSKQKRRNKSDLGEDFVAPDGGWAWVVCLAAGLSNFSVFPCLQQFGLMFRERFVDLGFSASQITTIINIVMAVSSLTGLVNGAMFRRYTYRRVAIFGGLLIFTGIVAGAFCVTVIEYAIFFSTVFGIGLGVNMSATSLAVNTYFKKKRRRATGFSWTITGLGPIIFPYIVTYMLVAYGIRWTILIFAAISLNSVMCAMTLQPVLWHVRKEVEENEEEEEEEHAAIRSVENGTNMDFASEYECKHCQILKRRKRSNLLISSQYLFNDDDAEKPGYEITDPGTPMLSRANDGWYGSKMSLASDVGGGRRSRCRSNNISRMQSINRGEIVEPSISGGGAMSKSNHFNCEKDDTDRYFSKASLYSRTESLDDIGCTCAEERVLLQKTSNGRAAPLAVEEQDDDDDDEEEYEVASRRRHVTLKQKIVIFFDLDLLKDFTFVNLVLGMTVILFGEMNFSILTPFILNEFGFSNEQISTAMSLIGGMDIAVRLLAPFFLEKIKLGNRMLFSFGIMAIALGRFLITLTRSFNVALGVFLLIGFGKGFRTIFSPLIIPSYVPLKRLPAASGLQLISTGFFTLACGPLIGMVTDATSYTVTIHVLNTFTLLAFLSWSIEAIVRRILRGQKAQHVEGNLETRLKNNHSSMQKL